MNRYQTFTTDEGLIRQLDAYRLTLSDDCQSLFWSLLAKLFDVDEVFNHITLRSWGWYFPPDHIDPNNVASRLFFILTGLVSYKEQGPKCPCCAGAMKFQRDASKPFGWLYVCASQKWVSRKEKRAKKAKTTANCRGTLSATKNTWIDSSNAPAEALFMTFAWVSSRHV